MIPTVQKFVHKPTVLENLAASSKSARDYLKLIKDIAFEVDELCKVGEAHLRMLKASTLTLDLGNGKSIVHTVSPTAPDAKKPTHLKIPKADQLAKNYAVVVELLSKSRDLDLIASELEIRFGKGADAATQAAIKKANTNLQLVRSKIDRALSTAGTYLTEVASQHAPNKFLLLVKNLGKMLSKGMVFKSVRTFLYVYPDGDGHTFLHYFWLMDVTDAEGAQIPEVFVTVSCTPTADGDMNFRLNTMLNFATPGRFPLGKEFVFQKPADAKNLAKILNFQLSLDNVANNYGRLSLRQLLGPVKLDKKSFSLENMVESLSVDGNSLKFKFTDAVDTIEKASKLASQINIELQTMIRRTKAKTRQKIDPNDFSATFFFVRPIGFPVNEEDLSFLQERFDLDDTTLDHIVETINKA